MTSSHRFWKPAASASLVILSFAIAAGSARADASTGPWERVSDKDGIVVERRVVDGSNLKEFVGRAVVEAPIGHVLAIVRDASRRCEWMPSCGGSYVLEEDVENRVQYSYYRTKAPWPVSDRDSVNRAQMVIDTEKRRVYLPFEARMRCVETILGLQRERNAGE